MAYNTKLKLIDAKMEQPSGGVLTLSGGTTIASGGAIQYEVNEHGSFTDRSLVDKEYVDSAITGGTEVFRFTEDIVVSIEEGKTFGRYENGDTIPASGKTPNEVILLAVQEPIDPTVSVTLNSTGTNTDFGEETKTVNLNLNYTINSLGATSTSAVLEWRRDTSGNWTQLTGVTTGVSGFTGTFLHTIDDSGDRFNTTSAEYRLVVVDSQSATNEENITFVNNGGTNGGFRRTMEGNEDNSVTGFQIVAADALEDYETANTANNNGLRERGNVDSNISFTVNSNRPNKALNRVRLQRNDGSGWVTIRDDDSLDTTSHTVTNHPDTTADSEATNIQYRVVTNDEFVTSDFTVTSFTSSHGRQVNLRFVTYFGHTQVSSEGDLVRADILGLHDKRIFLNNPSELTINNIISGPDGESFDNTYYTYLVYPLAYGTLSAVDILPAPNIDGAWLSNTDTITMDSEYNVEGDFRIYRSADPGGYNDVNVRWTW